MLFINTPRYGYAFFVLGICLYSLSDAIMKYFMPLYGVHQVIFLRSVFRFCPFLLFAVYTRVNPLKTRRIEENVFRSLLASCGTYAFMCAYNYSAMADVVVVGLSTSIFVIPLSVWILKERFHIHNAIAVILGFSGVCLALRPGSETFQIGIIFALAGAVISALNQVIVKRLSSTESELTIIFYHNISLIIMSLFVGVCDFTTVTICHTVILFIGGVIGTAAQYSIIHAFKLSTSSGLASAPYIMLIPNTIFDFFLYNKIPDFYIIGGLILILIGSLKAVALQSKL